MWADASRLRQGAPLSFRISAPAPVPGAVFGAAWTPKRRGSQLGSEAAARLCLVLKPF